jgi:hypothetical protein
MYKVRILTCCSGEPSLAILCRKLKKQKNVIIEQHNIENLNLSQANAELYNCLISTSSEFDFVIKLDADMVPTSSYSVFNACRIAKHMRKSRLTLPVLDFYTNSAIFGIHIISSSIHYSQFKRDSTPDSDLWIKEIDGNSLWYTKDLLFYHGVLPSEIQMLRFGYQRGRKLKNSDSSHAHWIVAQIIHKNFKYKQTKKNKLIFTGLLLGLDWIELFKDKRIEMSSLKDELDEIKISLEKHEIQSLLKRFTNQSYFYKNELKPLRKLLFIFSIYKNSFRKLLDSFIGNIKYKRIQRMLNS